MARYLNETEAAAAGFRLVHEPRNRRVALYGPGTDANATERLVGEAHYTLHGDPSPTAGAAAAAPSDTAAGTIDFDHTVVLPEFRGTGLSGLLARRAVTDPVVHGRRVLASCWFIEGYLARHPELLSPSA